jgi:hypothetical protein
MKKIFLLLALAFCVNVAFASNGEPVKESDEKNPSRFSLSTPQKGQMEGDAQCVLCGICNNLQVCVYCRCGPECNVAGQHLLEFLCDLGCCPMPE